MSSATKALAASATDWACSVLITGCTSAVTSSTVVGVRVSAAAVAALTTVDASTLRPACAGVTVNRPSSATVTAASWAGTPVSAINWSTTALALESSATITIGTSRSVYNACICDPKWSLLLKAASAVASASTLIPNSSREYLEVLPSRFTLTVTSAARSETDFTIASRDWPVTDSPRMVTPGRA